MDTDNIADLVSPSKVAVLRSYLSVASTLGISSGGPIGGLLTQTVGWRWYRPSPITLYFQTND